MVLLIAVKKDEARKVKEHEREKECGQDKGPKFFSARSALEIAVFLYQADFERAIKARYFWRVRIVSDGVGRTLRRRREGLR